MDISRVIIRGTPFGALVTLPKTYLLSPLSLQVTLNPTASHVLQDCRDGSEFGVGLLVALSPFGVDAGTAKPSMVTPNVMGVEFMGRICPFKPLLVYLNPKYLPC